MRTSDIAKVAIKNLRVQRKRTLLTMLGLIIGITSVVLILSLGAGAQALITSQIQRRGTDQMAVLAGSSDSKGPPAQALGIIITTLNDGDRQALLNKSNVEHIKIATGYLGGGATMQYESQEKFITYTGTNANYLEQEKVSVDQGRFFSTLEELQQARVVVLGSEVADEFFGNNDPIGKLIKIAKKQFRVIGVLETKGSSGFENYDQVVLIPMSVAQKQIKGVDYFSVIRMRIDDEKNLDKTVEQVTQTLIERHGEVDFSVRTIADLLLTLTIVTNVIRLFLVAVAGMSLFVGGVGVMNIMLVSVKQKTREIGLRKSVGAKGTDILRQFLFETVIIAIIAGTIGIVIGIVISYVVSLVVKYLGYETYSFIIDPIMVILPLIVSTLVGLVFGLLPAKRAAAMDPITALRYE